MIRYVETPKHSIEKAFRTIKFSKVVGYKSKIKVSVFLNINNNLLQREIEKIIPFSIATKRKKYLEINLTNVMKELTLKIIKY